MLESIFNEIAAISTAQHQICLIALPPDFQVGQARPLRCFSVACSDGQDIAVSLWRNLAEDMRIYRMVALLHTRVDEEDAVEYHKIYHLENNLCNLLCVA